MVWSIEEVERLDVSSLVALFHNEIAAIRIPHFFDQQMCQAVIQKISQYNVESYSDDPAMARVGITQAEHMHNKDLYFLHAADFNNKQEDLLKESRAILLLIINTLKKAWQGKVEIAIEDDRNQQYFAGLIRVIRRTRLHFDWAPHDAQDWTIGQISAQLAWNVYLQSSERGGRTRIYHRLWQYEDESYREAGSYSFKPSLVMEDEYAEICPRVGELVLFNSRNYHEVEETEGGRQRMSISSFVGLLKPEQQLLLWS